MPQLIRSNPLTPDFRYNSIARRYIDASGRFVSQAVIKSALNATLVESRLAMDILGQQLIAGQISLAQWQVAMAQQIKISHLAAGAAAKGGWAQLSQADYGAIGAQIKKQYSFLQGFADEIASGKQKLNGSLLRRARMYNDAANGTFETIRRRDAVGGGATEERRVLGKAEHCIDCLDYAGRGWQPINTLPPIGASICRTNCRCRFEFR